jgi:hypothetical protein
LREFLREKAREGLGGIEFPRQRQDEVSQMLALVEILTPLMRQKRPVSHRYARLATYPEAWLLYQIREAPEAELLTRCASEKIPERITPKAPPKRRRHRHRRGRGRARQRRQEKAGGGLTD